MGLCVRDHRLLTALQVLLYTRSKLAGAWSDAHGAYVIKHAKLPGFVDSHWDLNAGGTGGAAGWSISDDGFPSAGASSIGSSPAPSSPLAPSPSPAATEWTSSSSSAGIPRHVLHFVAYVPPRDRRPLLLLLPPMGAAAAASTTASDGGSSDDRERPAVVSPTNSYWMPDWGGVHIINPTNTTAEDSGGGSSGGGGGSSGGAARSSEAEQVQGGQRRQVGGSGSPAVPLAPDEMARLARAVVSELRALLGADLREGILLRHGGGQDGPAQVRRGDENPDTPGSDRSSSAESSLSQAGAPRGVVAAGRRLNVHVAAAPEHGFSEWEVDALARRRAAHNVAVAAQVDR